MCPFLFRCVASFPVMMKDDLGKESLLMSPITRAIIMSISSSHRQMIHHSKEG